MKPRHIGSVVYINPKETTYLDASYMLSVYDTYKDRAKIQQYQKKKIYTDEVEMATEDDLRIIDGRIFLNELEIRRGI